MRTTMRRPKSGRKGPNTTLMNSEIIYRRIQTIASTRRIFRRSSTSISARGVIGGCRRDGGIGVVADGEQERLSGRREYGAAMTRAGTVVLLLVLGMVSLGAVGVTVAAADTSTHTH